MEMYSFSHIHHRQRVLQVRARRAIHRLRPLNLLHQQTALPVGKIHGKEECASNGKASAVTGHSVTLERAVVRVGTLRPLTSSGQALPTLPITPP